jgi:hypothetical protein
MTRFIACTAILLVVLAPAGCKKVNAPEPKTSAAQDAHPVKHVETLPAGNIQEGARTMNRAADTASGLEQQKQERMDEAEARNK